MLYRLLKVIITFMLCAMICRALMFPDSNALSIATLMDYVSKAEKLTPPTFSIDSFPALTNIPNWLDFIVPIITFFLNIFNLLNFFAFGTINLVITCTYFMGYLFVA